MESTALSGPTRMNIPLLSLLFIMLLTISMASPLIREMSSSGEWGDAVDVFVPSGERITVLVSGADRIEPHSLPQISTEVFSVTEEIRVKDEIETRFPHLLIPSKMNHGSKLSAIRMHVLEEGEFDQTISCGNGDVIIKIFSSTSVRKSDCGFGFYTDQERYSDPSSERIYMRHMRDSGCNTMTPYGSGSTPSLDIARQIDAAIDEDLIDTDLPLMVLPQGSSGEIIDDARTLAKHRWPELIGYNEDEPYLSEHRQSVIRRAEGLRERGYRNGSAISGHSALWGIINPMDIWVMNVRNMTESFKSLARNEKKEIWAYTAITGTNAPLHRYLTGLWMFKHRPKMLLVWSYIHEKENFIPSSGDWKIKRAMEHAVATPGGVIGTVGLEGFRDGTIDYRVLCDLEYQILHSHSQRAYIAADWLQDVMDRVDSRFWPGGADYYDMEEGLDLMDRASRPIDSELSSIRKKAIDFTADLSKKE